MQTGLFLNCEQCARKNYRSSKGKKVQEKLRLKKFCKFCVKHNYHKEGSIK